MFITSKPHSKTDLDIYQMRYIIDAAFLQAKLLNRTLVLPSFVYARDCEYDQYTLRPT
jgi:hypothetical protein